jgi:uncharacterized protein (DUF2384 family)
MFTKQYVTQKANATFGSDIIGATWMNRANPKMGNKTPLEMCDTVENCKLVIDYLQKIDNLNNIFLK